MRKTLLYTVFTFVSLGAFAQQQIPNASFENWENSGDRIEPVSWNSNKTGGGFAPQGPQTIFKETNDPHTGAACVRIETKTYLLIAIVNGSLTTAVVNAPATDKSKGYIGTVHMDDQSNHRIAFTDRPDSLVGYYKYTQGHSSEKGKITAVLHTGDYYDPETPVSNNHPDMSANKIARALFTTSASNTAQWKRFSVPFDYVNNTVPEYIMITATSSENQLTDKSGSKLWIDDLELIYNPATPEECAAATNLNITKNQTSIDLAWTAPSPAPAMGYLYAVVPTGTTPAQADYATTANTQVSGITATTGANSTALVAGASYSVSVIAVCEHSQTGYSTPLTGNVTLDDNNEPGVGVKDIAAVDFNVYAADNKLIIDLSDLYTENAVVSVVDVTGRKIVNQPLVSNTKNSVVLPELSGKGIFFYSITGKGVQKTGKLVF